MILAILRSRTSWVGTALLIISGLHLYFWGLSDLTPTITLVEAEWSLTALLGAIYSADFIRDNILDWWAQAADNRDPGARLTVEIMLLIGWVLIWLHVLLLTLGIFAMLGPSSPDNAAATRIIDAAFTVVGQGLVGALALIRIKRSQLRSLGGSTT